MANINTTTKRHFLTLLDLTPEELKGLIRRGIELKTLHQSGTVYEPLKNKVLAMIFEKSSTRTRVSFEAGMAQLGGSAIFLAPEDTQLGRGEEIQDTARVLSRMADAIMIRTFSHEKLQRLTEASLVPAINGLTDSYHPCQLLADMQTYDEQRGPIEGKTVAWIGDGNNMCASYINAARQYGFKLNIACPPGYEPPLAADSSAPDVRLLDTPADAVHSADLVVTDVWASMGQEQETAERRRSFEPYQVTPSLMSLAHADALFMHCLPAHRDEEVSAEVLDGPQSVVWDEAENRLHAQKALLEFLLGPE